MGKLVSIVNTGCMFESMWVDGSPCSLAIRGGDRQVGETRNPEELHICFQEQDTQDRRELDSVLTF